MALRDRLGYQIDLKYYFDDLERSKAPPKFEYLISTQKWEVPGSTNCVATCYYLLGEKAEAAKFGQETVAATLECFYGDWRQHGITDLKTKDPAWWHAHSPWMDRFSAGLCWALAIGDWASAKQIADYPTDKCEVDVCCPKEGRAAYLALAYFFRGEPKANHQHHFDEIRRRKKEKPKRIVDMIEALQSKDGARFQQSLEAYLEYFRKREFKRNALDKLLCYDGTMLINIGKREGLDFKIPPEAEDHIIHLS